MRILLLTVAAGLGLAGPASAQGAFSTDEAARCGAVFARMVQAMQGAENVPPATKKAAVLGLAFWEYELTASAPGQEEELEKAVLSAFDTLNETMPGGGDAEGADARGDYLMAQARGCSDKLDAAYPEGDHPVMAQLRKAQAEANAQDPGLR